MYFFVYRKNKMEISKSALRGHFFVKYVSNFDIFGYILNIYFGG